jgi:hypothetical protein
VALDPLPDVELICCAWLDAHADIVIPVSTELPSTSAWPRLTLARIGGTPTVRRRLDAAQIQVSSWAATKQAARDNAALARATLIAMEGYIHASGVVTGVDDDLGLSWLPDDSRDPTIPRYVFSLVVYAHP